MLNNKSSEITIKNPVIIIGCPRSGTSLLFRILSTSKQLWSLYRESNDIWNDFFKFTNKEFKDETLSAIDLDSVSKDFILNEFHKQTLNNYRLGYFIREKVLKNSSLTNIRDLISTANLFYKKRFMKEYRLVEKTPKNCFRINFINSLFSDCKFIFLKRDGRSNINSLIEGWRAKGRYKRINVPTTPVNIQGYQGNQWKFLMPPGWKDYVNKPLEEVCAFQWTSSNKAALDGLKQIDEGRKCTISYEDLTENTYEAIKEICDFVDIPFSKDIQNISKAPPVVNYVTKPNKDKWKKNINLIEKTYPAIKPMMEELGYKI